MTDALVCENHLSNKDERRRKRMVDGSGGPDGKDFETQGNHYIPTLLILRNPRKGTITGRRKISGKTDRKQSLIGQAQERLHGVVQQAKERLMIPPMVLRSGDLKGRIARPLPRHGMLNHLTER